MERTKRFSYNPKRNSAVEILLRCYSLHQTMYRPAKEVDWCQCCQRGVALADAEGAADLFGDHDAAEVVDTANDASCFHISFSFSRRGHSRMTRGRFMNRPYNNFTNYDAIICKRGRFILMDLLFDFAMV